MQHIYNMLQQTDYQNSSYPRHSPAVEQTPPSVGGVHSSRVHQRTHAPSLHGPLQSRVDQLGCAGEACR